MLYGRDAERSRIAGLLEDARGGKSGVLVLRGEPGVGKSALLEEARAQASGMTVLSGCGIESEAQLPYAGLHQVVRPVLAGLDRLPSPQARALRGALGLGTGSADEWFLVSLAALTLLAEAAEVQPVLCAVDDAHWLDDASAATLLFTARRLEAEGIAMVFAAREGEARSFEALGLEELQVSGLEPEAAGDLLERTAPVPLAAEARERLIEGTDGNPLALLELASTLSEEQLGGLEPLLEPLPVGRRIEDAFLARVQGLPDEAQTALLVASADDSGSLATVADAAGRLGVEPDALDPAEEAGLVRVDGAQLHFRHPLIRSAVYQGATSSRRRAVHEALAETLDPQADDDRRAWHLAAATVSPDASVAEELERAARRAQQRSGFVAASNAFERAAALSADDCHRGRLLMGAVHGAWFSGRLERASMLLQRARPLIVEPEDQAEIDFWRGLVEVNAGVPADAARMLLGAADQLSGTNGARALYILGMAAIASGYSDDDALVAEIARRGEAIEAEGPVADFLAHFVHGMGAWFSADFELAAAELRTALALAEDADGAAPAAEFRGLLLLAGGAGLFLGDDRAAERFNRALAVRARELGSLPLLTQALPRLALSEIACGRWSSAAAGLHDGLQLARDAGQHQVVAHMLALLALIAGLRGDEEECRALADESRELAAERNLVHASQTARWAELALDLGLGNAEDALIGAHEIVLAPVRLWSGPDRIEAALRGGDDEAAAEWLASFEAWASSSGESWARAVSLRCEALVVGDQAEAEQLFEQALRAHAQSRRPFERARTELAFGEFLRRSRRRVEARRHLHAAVEGFENVGAALWAERARSELRASGQTARKRDPSTRGDLTAQELQIASLVASGLSNREVAAHLFLSPRTIDFHLRNIFRKLSITSRVQLAQLDLEPLETAAPV
ncbi:MAG TPA: AAA family ATPase [Gaiellaceae bacterium]